MQKLSNWSKNSKKDISKIKEDFKELLRLDSEKNKNLAELKIIIRNIHEDLENLEKVYDSRKENANLSIEDFELKKKLRIKKYKRSKSFGSWIFNNNEL